MGEVLLLLVGGERRPSIRKYPLFSLTSTPSHFTQRICSADAPECIIAIVDRPSLLNVRICSDIFSNLICNDALVCIIALVDRTAL